MESADVAAHPDFAPYWQAVHLGFHNETAEPATLQRAADQAVADRWLMRGSWDDDLPASAFDAPVSTFLSFDKTINVGAAELQPVHLITEVTVRPTHRRRGILRTMMTNDLTEARNSGQFLAALTVTEAGIYGRFGFGPATFVHSIEVDATSRFELRTRPAGSTQLVPQEEAAAVATGIFAQFHQTRFGSVDRGHHYATYSTGLYDAEVQRREQGARNLLHYDENGVPDGWAAYKIVNVEGWQNHLIVRDLVAANANAYLGLWEVLGSMDLVTKVKWNSAPLDDPLRWALADQRGYRVTASMDRTWVRVLDTPKALLRRGYAKFDTSLVLQVDDPMGFASGRFALTLTDGEPAVETTDAEPDVVLGPEELASLYLGGVTPQGLTKAGRIQADLATQAKLELIFMGLEDPYCNTYF